MDLVPSSPPFSSSLVLLPRKRVECQSYIRELLGTPNKLAEHVSQNRGYLGTSNPLRIRLHLTLPSPPSFLASPSLPRLFIALFVSGFVISFFFSLLFYFSQLSFLCRGNSPTVFPHVRRRDVDGYCFARVNVVWWRFFSPLCHRARELNSALFNVRERKRLIFSRKSFFE